LNALVAPAALNPASICDMEIPGDQLPAFLATTCQAVEASLKFMGEQAEDNAAVVKESLDKAEGNPNLVLAAAFAKPMVQSLPYITDSVFDTVDQEANEMDDAQFAAAAKEVVEAVGAISADSEPESVTAVRMAIAAAAFVNGATGDAGELAAALNAMLPADFQGPYDGETLVTLAFAGLGDDAAYEAMTEITGVEILIKHLLPPPPAPVPFDTQLTRRPVGNFHDRWPKPPGEKEPPVGDAYNNQCGCAVFVRPVQ